MRYEKKFVFNQISCNEVLNKILLSKAFFTEIYCERKVNNIYLDSFDFKNYQDNIAGTKNRIKQRIRWYGDTFTVERPILEYKIKEGELGRKEYYKLPNFTLDNNFFYKNYIESTYESFENSRLMHIYNEICELKPVIVNRYTRRYFLSGDYKYRITIDTDISFTGIREKFVRQHSVNSDLMIVEMKYNIKDAFCASDIMQQLGFSVSKNSKYVNGIKSLYFNDIEG